MSKKRKDKLLLNLKEGERYKHRVAMVNEEGGWNQHEPNSGMARMFVIMLLIHVMVIGGIIIYDFVNGDDGPTSSTLTSLTSPVAPSALPPTSVNAAALDKAMPIEDYATYEWRSGDSLPLVAEKLGVTEEVIIRLNMLDKGAQIDQNTILRYPRRPVVKALALGVAGANGEMPVAPAVVDAPPAAAAPAEAMALTPPGENLSLEATLLDRLTPAPNITPGQEIQESPPPSVTEAPAGAPAPKALERTVLRAPEKLPEVPKAKPVTREMLAQQQQPAKAPVKKIADAPPPAKTESAPKAASRGSYQVKPGDTLYGIASKHGVSVAELQKANATVKPERLRDGMKLVIPAK